MPTPKRKRPRATPDRRSRAAAPGSGYKPVARDGRFGIVILAAGKGTRLKSKLPKVLHRIGGKSILEHVIGASSRVLDAKDIFVVIGHEAEKVRAAVQHTGVNFVLQPEQLGTGDAMKRAEEALAPYEHVLVLVGDAPLIRPQTIERLRHLHLQENSAVTILTAVPDDPTGYGRIIRRVRNGKPTAEVEAIIEQKALRPDQLGIREINSGIYAIATKPLYEHIDRLTTDNPAREFYLTDMAAILASEGYKVVALAAEDNTEVLGVNSRAELAALDAALRNQKCAELMANGVTIFRPETCMIDADVEVGQDTVIEPFVQLLAGSRIGSDCHIGSQSIIARSEIANSVEVRPGCIINEANVADAAVLGPYAHLRPGSDIGQGAHVGNFVETKKAKLGAGSKANHLTYLGDAEIGAGVNVGAGTITCNYDGVNKHATVIEDGAFIGSDSTLVAPVRVGRGAYIGAASCITEDVPEDALAIGRSRQVVKQGWARQKRQTRQQKATSHAK
jgi:bifunctional UDP-N-acetylglucosamine pyrophosphorylase / glucosamine-1-phosphate N-acetyltransferase